jgi:hypothetical protein
LLEEGASSCDCCMPYMVLATASTAAKVSAQYTYQLGRGWLMERSITWGVLSGLRGQWGRLLGPIRDALLCVERRLSGNAAPDADYGRRGSRRVVLPANGISLFLDVWVGVEEAGVYLRSAFLSSSSASCSSSVDKSPRG